MRRVPLAYGCSLTRVTTNNTPPQYALTRAKEAEAQRQQELLAVQVKKGHRRRHLHCMAFALHAGLVPS